MKLLPAYILTAIALIVGLNSCDDNDGGLDASYSNFRYDVVTYDHYASGGYFTYLGRNDSSAVTLYAPTMGEPSNIKQGERVIMRYSLTGEKTAGASNITVYSLTRIITDSLRYNTGGDISTYPMHQVKMQSMWRSGKYINVHCDVEYTGKARQFYLLMDRDTWHNDTVQCYLIHSIAGDTTYFWRNCYGSFDVGNVWKLASCRTIRVHVNDLTFPNAQYYDFNK